jgi:hypothetical protein
MRDSPIWPDVFRARLARERTDLILTSPAPGLPKIFPKILVVVEGANDIHFLRHVSAVLHAADPTVPDLGRRERLGELIFIPFGGGDPFLWTSRLAGLGPAEFHLMDRDDPPETESHERAASLVNLRPRCRAVLTRKRSLENYLAPEAIFEARGITVAFSDDDNVAERIARHAHDQHPDALAWDAMPYRARKRRRDKVKKWLNREAVTKMTSRRIAQRDPEQEILGWLATIARLADGDA